MSTEHTPTPWYRVGHDLRGRQGPIEVCPATAHGLTDAVFILRAVNSYGPMLKALKAIQREMRHEHDTGDGHFSTAQVEAVEAAIVLALKED